LPVENFPFFFIFDFILHVFIFVFLCLQNVTVTVTDVNEPSTSLTLTGPQVIPASAQAGHVIGQFVVLDPDLQQTHTFLLTGPNSDIMTVSVHF
jgi:hypothetical protein